MRLSKSLQLSNVKRSVSVWKFTMRFYLAVQVLWALSVLSLFFKWQQMTEHSETSSSERREGYIGVLCDLEV